MGRRSSIDQLPPELRLEVDAAIKRGLTIDEIVAAVRQAGGEVSRSAVGRYAQQYREFAEQQREIASVAQAFGAEFGEADNLQGRLMTQLLTSLITRAVMPMLNGEEADLDPKDLHFIARAVKDASSASKIDVEREQKIREGMKLRAADAAEGAARKGGATPETIDLIRREILGLS